MILIVATKPPSSFVEIQAPLQPKSLDQLNLPQSGARRPVAPHQVPRNNIHAPRKWRGER